MSIDRDAVLLAAAGLLIRNRGASMGELAEAAGISRASLHRLVPTRDALIKELADLSTARSWAAVRTADPTEGDPAAALGRLIRELVPVTDLFNLLFMEQTLDEMYAQGAELDRVLIDLFERGQREGVFRADLSAVWMTEMLYALLGAAWSAAQSGRIATRDMATTIERSLLSGVAVTKETS